MSCVETPDRIRSWLGQGISSRRVSLFRPRASESAALLSGKEMLAIFRAPICCAVKAKRSAILPKVPATEPPIAMREMQEMICGWSVKPVPGVAVTSLPEPKNPSEPAPIPAARLLAIQLCLARSGGWRPGGSIRRRAPRRRPPAQSVAISAPLASSAAFCGRG